MPASNWPFLSASLAAARVSAALLVALAVAHPLRAAAPDAGAGSPTAQAAQDRDGPLVRIVGARQVSPGRLRSEAAEALAVLEQDSRAAWAVDDAAYQMEAVYRRQGYAFANVDYHLSGPEAVFEVEEGPRVFVDAVRIAGNQQVPEQQLLRFFPMRPGGLFGLSPFVAAEVESAVANVRAFYQAQGFRDARVERPDYTFSPERERVTVVLQVHEGVQYVITEVQFENAGRLEAEALRETARMWQGRVFIRTQVRSLREHVEEIYANLGYPSPKANVRANPAADGATVLSVQVETGTRVRLEGVQVLGTHHTHTDFIREMVTLRPGDWYAADQVRKSFHNLYATGLFKRIRIDLAGNSLAARRDLVVSVEETLGGEVFVEAGYGSYEQLRGRVGWRQRNLWGRGRALRVEAGASFKSYNLLIGLSDPRLLHTAVQADLPLFVRFRREPSFWRREIGGNLVTSSELAKDLGLNLGYELRATRLGDVTTQTDTFYRVAGAQGQLQYNTRDDPFWPTQGQLVLLSANVSDPLLGAELDLTRITFAARFFQEVGENLILALRYDTGLVWPQRGGRDVPVGERFFTGGASSVRAYGESSVGPRDAAGQPLGGLGMNIFSAEFRYRFLGNFAVVLFSDWGNVAPGTNASQALADFFVGGKSAVGLGLAYLLPIGPVRVDAAFDPQTAAGDTSYAVHFSVGTAF